MRFTSTLLTVPSRIARRWPTGSWSIMTMRAALSASKSWMHQNEPKTRPRLHRSTSICQRQVGGSFFTRGAMSAKFREMGGKVYLDAVKESKRTQDERSDIRG